MRYRQRRGYDDARPGTFLVFVLTFYFWLDTVRWAWQEWLAMSKMDRYHCHQIRLGWGIRHWNPVGFCKCLRTITLDYLNEVKIEELGLRKLTTLHIANSSTIALQKYFVPHNLEVDSFFLQLSLGSPSGNLQPYLLFSQPWQLRLLWGSQRPISSVQNLDGQVTAVSFHGSASC